MKKNAEDLMCMPWHKSAEDGNCDSRCGIEDLVELMESMYEVERMCGVLMEEPKDLACPRPPIKFDRRRAVAHK